MITIKILFWICFILVFYTFVGYGLVLALRVKANNRKGKNKVLISEISKDELPDVTLLVTAYNEENIVKDKMDNIRQLIYPQGKLHLMWVTDGSTDRTNELLSQYPEVEVIFQPQKRGRTSAINHAMSAIKTPITVISDAVTMLNAEAINEIVKPLKDEKTACVVGERKVMTKMRGGIVNSEEELHWRYESKIKKMEATISSVMGVTGELYGFRTQLFELIDDDILMSDYIFSLRLLQKGYRIAYTPQAYSTEKGNINMHEEEKRKVRISAGGLQGIFKVKDLLNLSKYKGISLQYISHRMLRWSLTPIAFFLMFPLNLFLAFATAANGEAIVYLLILMGQMVFYLLGYWGYVLSRLRIKAKYLYSAYYFLFMNINSIKGFFYLINHSSKK